MKEVSSRKFSSKSTSSSSTSNSAPAKASALITRNTISESLSDEEQDEHVVEEKIAPGKSDGAKMGSKSSFASKKGERETRLAASSSAVGGGSRSTTVSPSVVNPLPSRNVVDPELDTEFSSKTFPPASIAASTTPLSSAASTTPFEPKNLSSGERVAAAPKTALDFESAWFVLEFEKGEAGIRGREELLRVSTILLSCFFFLRKRNESI